MTYHYYYSADLGCVYRLQGDTGALQCAPMRQDGTFDVAEFGDVEPSMVGEERVTFQGVETDLYGVFATVTSLLESAA